MNLLNVSNRCAKCLLSASQSCVHSSAPHLLWDAPPHPHLPSQGNSLAPLPVMLVRGVQDGGSQNDCAPWTVHLLATSYSNTESRLVLEAALPPGRQLLCVPQQTEYTQCRRVTLTLGLAVPSSEILQGCDQDTRGSWSTGERAVSCCDSKWASHCPWQHSRYR